MSKLKTLTTLGAATALAALMASTAGAATLSLAGGTAGSIPGDASNEALLPLGLSNPLAGYFGTTVVLDNKAKVTVTLFGAEAANTNTFKYNPTGETLTYGANADLGHFDPSGLASLALGVVNAGTLDFSFLVNSVVKVTNGDANTNVGNNVNFFASFAHDATAKSGKSLYLFLDDGAGPGTDNHDDLVLRVDVAAVPVPAAGFLLLGGLGALGALSRRRKAA